MAYSPILTISALFAYTCLYIDARLRNFLVRISFLRGLLGIVVCAGLNKTLFAWTKQFARVKGYLWNLSYLKQNGVITKQTKEGDEAVTSKAIPLKHKGNNLQMEDV